MANQAVTSVSPAAASVVPPGALTLTYEYAGNIGDLVASVWVEDVDADKDIFETQDGLQLGTGTISVTIPSGLLKSGKAYLAGVTFSRQDMGIDESYLNIEYESNFLVSSSTLDDSYAVYYTTAVSEDSERLDDWEDYPDATWRLL